MKLKKEYFILGGIILVLIMYLVFSGGKSKMSYKVPDLKNLGKGEIDTIEVTNAEKIFTLKGKDDIWKILPQEYPADKTKVKNMLEAIEGLTLSELASERENYKRFELDEENKIAVKAYKDGKLLRGFDVGKVSPTSRHTFVKLEGDPRVYHAMDSFRSDFDQKVKNLRDKTVLALDRNEINEIEITDEKGRGYSFVKKMLPVEEEAKPEGEDREDKPEEPETPMAPKEEEAWVMPDGKKANKSAIDSVLSSLYDLRCDEYMEDKTKEEIADPVVYTLKLKGAKEYVIQIFQKQDEEGGKYPALSSENAYPFLLATYSAERIMKKPEDLMKQEGEE